MADRAAEIPTQPEQKKLSVVDRVKGRLAKFWERVGPGSVYQENVKTLQAMDQAMGPGRAQDVFRMLEMPLKTVSMANGIVTSVVDIALGAWVNKIYRRFTRPLVAVTTTVGGLVGGATGNPGVAATGVFGGYAVGESIRTVSGIGIGVGVAEAGVAHKIMNVAQRTIRPIPVGIAETVGRITRGWDSTPAEVNAASAA